MTRARATTTLFLRSMPVDVVREAKAEAARRGLTLASYVARTLSRRRDESEDDGELDRSTDWFERNRSALVKRYPDEYVAIVDDEVVDHDADFDALAMRVFAKLGMRSVFMPRVTAKPRTLRIPSPRLRG